MAPTVALPGPGFLETLLETYAVNDRMNQIILERLDPRAWRAKPPGRSVRPIAAIFAHMQNIRRKWVRLSAPHLKLPPQLNRIKCTQHDAQVALAQSARLCSEMLRETLDPEGRIKHFHRDGWAKPWPGGPAMFTYMVTHDAHHRGQVCMLAHQLGFPIRAGHEIWMWEKLWKQCGFSGPR